MSNFSKTWAVYLLAGLLLTPAFAGAQSGNLRSPDGVRGFYLPYDKFTVPYELFGVRGQVPLISATGAYVLLVWNDPAAESDTTNWSGYRIRRTIPGVSPSPLTAGAPNGQVAGQLKARDAITQICLSQAAHCNTDYNLLGIGGGFFFNGFRGNRRGDGTYLIDIHSEWNSMVSGAGQELRGIWGSSATDVFAVGARGLILHSSGSGWIPMVSPTPAHLNGVSGVSASSVFAVTENGAALRFDGAGWSPVSWATAQDPDPTDIYQPVPLPLRSVWATSPTSVFAVGDSGSVFHYDGTQWDSLAYSPSWLRGTRATRNALLGVWASSPTNAIAVGDSGLILRCDGARCDTLNSGTRSTLRAVWGASANDVFAAGDGGTILRYNGSAWSAMPDTTHRDLRAIWGNSAGDVFAAGGAGEVLHYDGNPAGTWTPMTSVAADRITGLWGSANRNMFAVGGGGTILNYDGTNPVVDECDRCRDFLDVGNLSGFRSRYAVTSIDTTSGQYEEFLESEIRFGDADRPGDIVEILPASRPADNLERVIVVPNPYKRAAEWDLPGQRGIHFVHLPDGATVRVFTSSLDFVREMKHDARGNPGGLTGELLWDMRNADGREVETGIYVYQVETTEGRTREGHFVIIK
jgi:hypothetical protein